MRTLALKKILYVESGSKKKDSSAADQNNWSRTKITSDLGPADQNPRGTISKIWVRRTEIARTKIPVTAAWVTGRARGEMHGTRRVQTVISRCWTALRAASELAGVPLTAEHYAVKRGDFAKVRR